MNWFVDCYRSAVGKKAAMAVTGVILYLYIVIHMLGNLKLYQGPAKLNAYAAWLREIGAPALPYSGALWIIRILLLVAVSIHILAATQLTLLNRAARPITYQKHTMLETSYAARTMRYSDVIILLFVIFHLLHFTWGTVHPDFRPGCVLLTEISCVHNCVLSHMSQ